MHSGIPSLKSEIVRRPLGRSGFLVSPIAFGGFKIGRNQKTKYPAAYELPSDDEVSRLLDGVLDLGINFIDTAPAYGVSEERIGHALEHRRKEFVLGTKVGETFVNGQSCYDFSSKAIEASVALSLRRLRTDVIDVLLLHSDGRDRWIQSETDAVPLLIDLKRRGLARGVGLSGKTPEGVLEALEWADVIMVEYHVNDRSQEAVIAEASRRGVGVLVKKGLASGHLAADAAVRFVVGNPNVASLVIGGLSLAHFASNVATACRAAHIYDQSAPVAN